MLFVVFASICFAAMINKIQSSSLYPTNLSLLLINSTSPNCEINKTKSNSSYINLCLEEQYNYQCTKYNNSVKNGNDYNISLSCILTSNNSKCHNIFIGKDNNNITLDCLYKSLNLTYIGSQLSLTADDECMYGIHYENHNSSSSNSSSSSSSSKNSTSNSSSVNNKTLICQAYVTPIVVTTFNNTKTIQESVKYYKFPLFGIEVSKHLVKSYGILIIVAIIVVSCIVAMCCYGLCSCFCSRHMAKRNRSNSDSNNNNANTKMPQSSQGYSI